MKNLNSVCSVLFLVVNYAIMKVFVVNALIVSLFLLFAKRRNKDFSYKMFLKMKMKAFSNAHYNAKSVNCPLIIVLSVYKA